MAEEAEAEIRKSAEANKATEENGNNEAAVSSSTVTNSKCPFGFSASASGTEENNVTTSSSAAPSESSEQNGNKENNNNDDNDQIMTEEGNTVTEGNSASTASSSNNTESNQKSSDVDKEKLRSLVPAAKIVTVNENIQKESLTPDQFNEYCQKLFKFRVIRVLRFRSWNARRKFTKNRKNLKNIQRPTLPDGTKLIKFPVLVPGDGKSNPRARREWIMNPSGKSYVCILHEYVQHALKKQPTYEFKELENAATPYAATVSINDLKYGTGYGTSKRQAKSEAARETLEILIPEMKDKITGVKQDKSAVARSNQKDLSVRRRIDIS